jgi:hypothetical protein
MFNLVNQATLRESQHIDMLVVNSRAFSYREELPVSEADVLFALDQGMVDSGQVRGLAGWLLAMLEADGLSVQLIDGSEATLGYEVGGASQAEYLKATENKNLVMLWLSPLARAGYRQQDKNIWQIAQFNALDMTTIEQSLLSYVLETGFVNQTEALAAIQPVLFKYIENPDILRLQQVIMLAHKNHYYLNRLLDPGSKQAFLLIHNSRKKLVAIANLLPANKSIKSVNKQKAMSLKVMDFISQRSAWLQADIKE